MKKFFFLFTACLIAVSAMAKDKMVFVVSGPEEVYNQIRVINESSLDDFTCRVVIVDNADNVQAVYGHYHLNGKEDTDSNLDRIWRGTRVGIQLPNDFEKELSFDVEYVDRPFFDYIIIHLRDKEGGYSDTL